MTRKTMIIIAGGTSIMMMIMDESMTVMSLAKMLVLKGNLSDMVSVSVVSAHIILDLLLGESVSYCDIYSEL